MPGPGGGVIARERVAPAKLRAGHARPLPGVVGVGVPDDLRGRLSQRQTYPIQHRLYQHIPVIGQL